MKLNLGCGLNKREGYVNVDMYPEGSPDLVCDLESTPWIWEADSIDEILFNHSLEHMGGDTKVFLAVMKEIYRVCRNQATVQINVPHPRHDNFIGDPTHVRILTPQVMSLFSKRLVNEARQSAAGNTPLALYLDVDFEMGQIDYILEQPYADLHRRGQLVGEALNTAIMEKNNVVAEIHMTLRVMK